jgi:hypothetical protein
MNIDPKDLKPKTEEEFKLQNGQKVPDLVSKTRFNHYKK